MEDAYMRSKERTLEMLDVEQSRGLDDRQVAENRKTYGENAFRREKPVSLARRIIEAASEPMIILLILAGVIALGVNIAHYFTGGEANFLECIGIFAAISLSVAITVVMEGRSAKAFEALSKMNEDILVKVVRSGKVQMIPQDEVVVGDILYVETGDKLPADGRLLESTDLQSDESALTGESMPAVKDAQLLYRSETVPIAERANMLFSGSYITGGYGTLVITGVGESTEFGKIAKELSSAEKTSTPLQEKLAQMGKRITLLGFTVAALVFLIRFILLLKNGTADLNTVSEAFITSIVLIVAAVPEGLPTIVAVALSVNIIKMSKQNALVKKMIACETIGSINIICSDKTGTLTENRMTVTDVYTDNGLMKPAALENEALLTNFCINSTADLHIEEDRTEFIGNPTECALLSAAQKAGWNYLIKRSQTTVVHVFPFSSEEKNMTTIVELDGSYMAYSKGSPEKVLALCNIAPEDKDEVEAQIVRFQENAGRVIAFAHRNFPALPAFEKKEIERDMVFDGFVAIADPLREDVFAAVERCRQAGIDVKILTGDNIVTAGAIAKELNLLDEGKIAVEAGDLEELSDEQLSDMLPGIRVIARSTPGIKMRVVNTLKAGGNVVAVTGDGINDAPALKNADVGIAMGISGTEVAKEASDIVLLDDSFATIAKAVQWGRGIYENLQRFIQFQLTVNLSSVVVILSSLLAGLASPFSALQILWINIIMDGPPALTLGLEPIRDDLMGRKPTRRDESIITGGMLRRIVLNGIFISIVVMSQYVSNFLGGTPEQMTTILFTLFVLFQLFNAFNCREMSGGSILSNLSGNGSMLLVIFITFWVQVLITQFGGAFSGTVPLSLTMWLKMLAVAFSVIIVSELLKLVPRIIKS